MVVAALGEQQAGDARQIARRRRRPKYGKALPMSPVRHWKRGMPSGFGGAEPTGTAYEEPLVDENGREPPLCSRLG